MLRSANKASGQAERRVQPAPVRRAPPPLPTQRAAAEKTDVIDLSRRRPTPQLLLPISAPVPRSQIAMRGTGPSVVRDDAGRSFSLSLAPSLAQDLSGPGAGAVRVAPWQASQNNAPVAIARTIPRQESRAGDVLGFALAWLMTTGAAAVVAGHMIARSQSPLVVRVPMMPSSSSTLESAAPSSCPKSWEPPTMAVNDLPMMPQAHAVEGDKNANRPLATKPREEAPRPKAWAALTRRARAAEVGMVSPPTKAKGSPKSLEDWMRASVQPR